MAEKANEIYDLYFDSLNQIYVAKGMSDAAWNSTLGMERFAGLKDFLIDTASAGVVTSSAIASLQDSNPLFAEYVSYLQKIGLYSATDKDATDALANSINEMARKANTTVYSYLDILDLYADKFDALSDALQSVAENGVVSADAMRKILTDFPSLEKYFTLGSNGYVLADQFAGMTQREILQNFAGEIIGEYAEKLEELTAGTEEYEAALKTLQPSRQHSVLC